MSVFIELPKTAPIWRASHYSQVLRLVVSACAKLHTLYLSFCQNITDLSIVRIAECCRTLGMTGTIIIILFSFFYFLLVFLSLLLVLLL